jgi:hypothetical protein
VVVLVAGRETAPLLGSARCGQLRIHCRRLRHINDTYARTVIFGVVVCLMDSIHREAVNRLISPMPPPTTATMGWMKWCRVLAGVLWSRRCERVRVGCRVRLVGLELSGGLLLCSVADGVGVTTVGLREVARTARTGAARVRRPGFAAATAACSGW